MDFEELFKLEEAKKTNMLVSGTNASGKTNLAAGVASVLNNLGYKVIVFDVSGAWRKTSDLPVSTVYSFKATNTKDTSTLRYVPLNGSGVYDLSLLTLSDTRRLVEDETSRLWLGRAGRHDAAFSPMWFVFEEAEIYLKNIRGSLSENVFRILHVGRNLGIRGILLTTDLALLDASVIRLCQIRFHGMLGIEENGKKKFTSYYGKEATGKATKLAVGMFLRLCGLGLDVVTVSLYVKPVVVKAPTIAVAPTPMKPQKLGWFKQLFG